MSSKYDTFWEQHLDAILAAMSAALTGAPSAPLALTGLDRLGERGSWDGKLEIVNGQPVYDSGAHVAALGEVLAPRLPESARNASWALTIGKDLALTVQKVDARKTTAFDSAFHAAKLAETRKYAEAQLGPLTPEPSSVSLFKQAGGVPAYVLYCTRKDHWYAPDKDNLEAVAAAGGHLVLCLSEEATARADVWVVPAAELVAEFERKGTRPTLKNFSAYHLILDISDAADIVKPLQWDIRPYRRESTRTEITRSRFWPAGWPRTLAHPFNEMFASRAEAEWALGLLGQAAARLGLTDPDDPMTAFTLVRRAKAYHLHLNYGQWLVFGLAGANQKLTVELALFRERVDLPPEGGDYFQSPGMPPVSVYSVDVAKYRAAAETLWPVYEETLDYAREVYAGRRASPYHKYTVPQLAQAALDPAARDRLLAEGLQAPVPDNALPPDHEPAPDPAPDPAPGPEPDPISTPKYPIRPDYPLAQFAADTGFPAADLARWVASIERKGQAILYGPPGTGKTYVAERLARHLAGGGDGVIELVQFHPAYAYEDFIQGIRPTTTGDGGLAYPTVPGRFLEFCRAAEGRGRSVLIVDEINRANLARVFGELMYLLEYRDREVPLAGGGTLRIPANVRVIGTMNTADRSIALVDHALRRRFAFLALYPNYDILRDYHRREATGYPVERLVGVLKRLNAVIADPHYQVGISFFMRQGLAREIEDIWSMEIQPYLDEYFYDQPDTAQEFVWSKVRVKLQPDANDEEPA